MKLEVLPDITRVLLAKDIEEIETEDGATMYGYAQAVFELPEGREETAESIAASFNDWWEYAGEDHVEPTLDERVDILEEVVAMLMEG